MKPGLSQQAGLRQELKINPRLYQAMDLLYMPLLDLQQHLKQELLTNPFLELVEPEDEEGDGDGEEAAAEGEERPVDLEEAETSPPEEREAVNNETVDWEDVLLEGHDANVVPEEHEEREFYEPVSVERRDLDDHLREQVTLLDLTPRQRLLADEFLGNITEEGYLGCALDEILRGINEVVAKAAEREGFEGTIPFYTADEAEAMLRIIQQLDPPGVAARDLRECLLLQLRDVGQEDALHFRLLRDFFDELIAHRWSEIAKRAGIAPADVQRAADAIAKLDPKPGLRHNAGSEGYIIPDLIVEKIDGQYHVFTNDGNVPRLKVSRSYQELARDRRKLDGESRDFIAAKLNAATWMVQAIEQRRQTMLKVMHFIVDRQRDFLERGVRHLRPLTLREVAEAIDMHESTISRVTNEKFVQTPRGVLPLKFFFSSGLSTTGGEDVSARGIRDQIEKLIAGEDARDPLTDQQIVAILKDHGVNIARRTVAKYRDQLGVLSARMRRRV